MGFVKYARRALAQALLLTAAVLLTSCDSSINRCFGVNLEGSLCVSETILTIGQQEGLSCMECVGEDTGDVFSINFSLAALAGSASPGTAFGFLNRPDLWLAEFSDCRNINLFDTSLDELGRFVKGEFAGALEDLTPFQIDKLSLFINIPGVRVENATCNFCADSIPPRCLEVIIVD